MFQFLSEDQSDFIYFFIWSRLSVRQIYLWRLFSGECDGRGCWSVLCGVRGHIRLLWTDSHLRRGRWRCFPPLEHSWSGKPTPTKLNQINKKNPNWWRNASIFLQTFVLHRMVKGANSTIILSCVISLLLSSLIAFIGCRSLPSCGCYDNRTGLVRRFVRLRTMEYHFFWCECIVLLTVCALHSNSKLLCPFQRENLTLFRKRWFLRVTLQTQRWCARGRVRTSKELFGGSRK